MPGTMNHILLVLGFLLISTVEAKLNIIILAGQSNMMGRGGVAHGVWDGFVPFECRPTKSILRLSGNNTWEIAKEPLHIDINVDVRKTCGVGPGMPFAHSVLRRNPSFGKIGLVPCAKGETNISQWQRGTFLYNQLMHRASVAVTSGGILRGILWYQGESDTGSSSDASHYKNKLEEFFLNVRADLVSPLLPIVQVAIITENLTNNVDTIREAQLGTKLPNVRCVNPKDKGFQFNHDGLHLTTQSQVKLGEMLADAFLQIIRMPPHPIGNGAQKIGGSRRHFLLGLLLIGVLVVSSKLI